GLLLDGTLTGRDLGFGLADVCLDLLISFLPGLVSGTLQLCYSLLKGVYLLGNAHVSLLDPAGSAGNLTAVTCAFLRCSHRDGPGSNLQGSARPIPGSEPATPGGPSWT